MSDEPTLKMRLTDGAFVEGLRAYVQTKADGAGGLAEGNVAWVRNHVAALREFDNFLAGLPPDDQRLVALDCIAKKRTPPKRFESWRRPFSPTEKQEVLFARLGTSESPPRPSLTFDELLAAAVVDLIEEARRDETRTSGALADAEARVAELSDALDGHARQGAELEEGRAEIGSLKEEIKELERDVEELRTYVAAGVGKEPAQAEPEKPPRRTKVDGETGVYFRDSTEGRVYEIGFPDDTGKQRWKAVGPDLQEAIDLRQELAGKPYEPEEAEAVVA